MEAKQLAAAIAASLDKHKAEDLRVIGIGELSVIADYFVIATGTSTTHVAALADEADFQLGRQGVNVLRTEGHEGKRWILLDYGSVIVHVFTKEAHYFYDLEHLWADGEPMPANEWMKPADATEPQPEESRQQQ